MSKTKNLISLLSSTEKPEFDQVIKAYLKEEYGYNKIVYTDGINDTGIDIKVFDFKEQKIQFQLTTQKSKTPAELRSFDKKLEEDLEKAKVNHDEYKYSNKLIFFYSYPFTNKKIREYEKDAFKKHQINLELIEANRIAEESENIIEIQKILYKSSELDKFQIDSNRFEDDQENLVFDMLSFGKPSDFKIQIIESFILQYIYKEQTSNLNQLITICESKFSVTENKVFYDRLIGKLLTEKRIKKSIDKSTYILSDAEQHKIKIRIDQHNLDEKIFLRDISKVLELYKQEHLLTDYVVQLKELYSNNFSSDLMSLINENDDDRFFGIIKEFMSFIKKNVVSKQNQKPLAKELLIYCLSSKFVQKIAASKVYCNNINNTRLEKYLTTQKRVFIDTSIALYSICYFYNTKAKWSNYFFRISKSLMEYANEKGLSLNISKRYNWEIQNHIKEAFNIIPFTEIKNFSKLGKSRNVFYNYFLHLRESDLISYTTTFDSFLKDFGFSQNSTSKSLNSKIEAYLEDLNINTHELEKEYDIEETNKIFEKELLRNNKFKTAFGRNNDSIMVEFLADADIDIHPVQPIFVTWDKTFFDVKKVYLKEYPKAQKWLTLPPSKLIDAYAILKFSINEETVTDNLLALISDDLITNAHSLIDTLKNILDPANEIGLKYTNQLAEIREKEINDIAQKVIVPPENLEGEAVIDDVFYQLTTHYTESEGNNKLNSFKEIFTKEDLIEEVIDVLRKTVAEVYKNHKINKELFSKFDHLIERVEKAHSKN